MDNIEDRRQCGRVLFSIGDKIKGTFTYQDSQDKTIEANIMNVGEGGMCCTYKKDQTLRVEPGDLLILKKIDNYSPLDFLINIDAEIKWRFEDDFFDHIEFGIEFLNLTDSQQDQLHEFVSSWDTK